MELGDSVFSLQHGSNSIDLVILEEMGLQRL